MELNKKNISKIILIVFASIVFFELMQNFSGTLAALRKLLSVLSPFIMGLCVAFILNVPLRFLETRVFAGPARSGNKIWAKCHRAVCLLLSILIVAAIIFGVTQLIFPQIKQTAISIAAVLPEKAALAAEWVNALMDKYNILSTLNSLAIDWQKIDWQNISSKIIGYFKDTGGAVINTTIGAASSIFSGVFNTVVGLAFSMYLLGGKERLARQCRKLFYALCKRSTADRVFYIVGLSNGIFSNFVIGQCTEAVILGVLCYIGMSIFAMPYAVMISSLIAVTALIPVFGALIGTSFGALMIMLQSPMTAVWFVVFIIVLQQIESNVIYPRVVGSSVGLPGIWVLFSVTVGGNLFGAAGLIISVPVSAVLYCLLREFINARLKHRHIQLDPAPAASDAPEDTDDTEVTQP